MLFNSHIFLFVFLPAALLAMAVVRGAAPLKKQAVLAVLSLTFYGWFVPAYVLLLLGSITVNYLAGAAIARRGGSRAILIAVITFDLLLLGVYKYLDFLIGTANSALSLSWPLVHLVLPLAISFFTFQQIMFVVDLHRGQARLPGFLEFLLFVSFFPHQLAGPLLHPAEIIPQFRRPDFGELTVERALHGATWFSIGLAKKVLIADTLAPIADTGFGIAVSGGQPSFFEAWSGTLAFTFQIYFDFSGYSDMAIGLAILFGVILPLNFAAPYRATSIIEFWRRWHMTLSRFLRDYLYIPLGGNRHGPVRRYVNLLTTMLLGGLWHGANWTFVIWGGLHGVYLIVNHWWRSAKIPLPVPVGWVLTFLAVCFAWVFFRSENFVAAWDMVRGMAGMNGLVLAAEHRPLFGPAGDILAALGVRFEGLPAVRLSYAPLFATLFLMVLLLPTTQEFMGRVQQGIFRWRPNAAYGMATGIMLAVSILGVGRSSEFIYFQF